MYYVDPRVLRGWSQGNGDDDVRDVPNLHRLSGEMALAWTSGYPAEPITAILTRVHRSSPNAKQSFDEHARQSRLGSSLYGIFQTPQPVCLNAFHQEQANSCCKTSDKARGSSTAPPSEPQLKLWLLCRSWNVSSLALPTTSRSSQAQLTV